MTTPTITRSTSARTATHELTRLNPALKGGRKWEHVAFIAALNAVPTEIASGVVELGLATAREIKRQTVALRKL